MRSVLSFAVLAVVAGLVIPRYATAPHAGRPGSAILAAQPAAGGAPAAQASNRPGTVIVPRAPNGHFQVEGRVDGRRLVFLVDTGASLVVLTADAAATLGLHPAAHDFTAVINTANGTAHAAPVRLDMVEIDDLVVRDVPALVMPQGALAGNLLGMSFLSRLRRFEIADGKLVLEQ